METVIAFLVGLIYLSVLWVVVLVVYNLVFEPFDFGALGTFAGKSALLITIVALISVIPYIHWFSLFVWWLGLALIFKKDLWECRVLVFLIWGLSIVLRIVIFSYLL